MTTITYNLSDSINSPMEYELIKKYLDKLYVQEVITSYNITDGLLTLVTIVEDPSTIFNLGSVFGLAIANVIADREYYLDVPK